LVDSAQEELILGMKISNFLSRKQNSNDQAGGLSIPCKECGMKFTEQERLKKHKKIAHSGRGERKKPSSP
jgi:uncharacterized Zn-finger protein